ncbi:hypothetical protein [Spirosoma sp. KNUC1025]|uniref:hypothetical protein n=1 Tax=Spirosoma sp. KNUC1025 TaxID=2894082 RepID=UPI00386C6000|nr:hypothetical protein LN737_28985 [Spirosoma sp. KNUC1025]
MNYLQTGNRYARWLTASTLFYLLFPFLLFLAGWIRLLYAIPACFFLLISAYYTLKQTRSDVVKPVPISYQIGVLLLATYWCLTAGLGEWMPQTTDFYKHNLILADLIRFDWPVRYKQPGEPFLCYYLAFYLPIALAGKLTGLDYVPIVSFLWSLGGLFIIFNWILAIGGSYRLGALVGFGFLSGFHVIRLAVNKLFALTPVSLYKSLPPLVYYPYTIKQWLYIPQQAMGAWLVMGWVYVDLFQRKRYNSVLFICSLGLFYSPFAIIGLAPLVIAAFPSSWRQFISIPNFIGVPILLFFLGGYYSAHYPLKANGWNIPRTNTEMGFLMNTVCTDILLPFLIVWYVHRHYKSLTTQQMAFMAIASLMKFILVFYYVGYHNDLLMSASITMSVLFFILMGISLQQASELSSATRVIRFISISLIIVSCLPLYMHVYLFIDPPETRRYAEIAPRMSKTVGYTINDLNKFMHYRFKPNAYYDFSKQYIGDPNHFFNRYMLK